ncbi:MAG: hypothetical protein LUG47_03265 [Clostridiales bacterium]|nr:hypothetical protein [Clostridiales bacterium]
MVICASTCATFACAIDLPDDGSDSDLDVLDVIISAYIYMNSDDEDMDLWPDVAYVADLVPLYDADGEQVAWYLRLTSGEFAVVNNNKDNPTLIEYGESDNKLIRNILDNIENPHIIYNSPFEIYDTADKSDALMQIDDNEATLYDNYPDLTEENEELKSIVASCREIVEAQMAGQVYAPTDSNSDYGFISDSSMSSSSYNGSSLSYGSTSWAIMSDYTPSVQNHCGATCITNAVLLIARKNSSYSSLKKSTTAGTLESVYNYVGNGPIVTASKLMSGAKSYFTSCGHTLNYSSANSFSDVVTAIGNNRPCCILLENSASSWHWVLAVGWRQYSSGGNYFQIVTGWSRTDKYFYKVNSVSTWVSGASIWAS